MCRRRPTKRLWVPWKPSVSASRIRPGTRLVLVVTHPGIDSSRVPVVISHPILALNFIADFDDQFAQCRNGEEKPENQPDHLRSM